MNFSAIFFNFLCAGPKLSLFKPVFEVITYIYHCCNFWMIHSYTYSMNIAIKWSCFYSWKKTFIFNIGNHNAHNFPLETSRSHEKSSFSTNYLLLTVRTIISAAKRLHGSITRTRNRNITTLLILHSRRPPPLPDAMKSRRPPHPPHREPHRVMNSTTAILSIWPIKI